MMFDHIEGFKNPTKEENQIYIILSFFNKVIAI